MDEMKQAFLRRTALYLQEGFDRFAAADFAAGLADPADGPVLDVGTGKGLLAIALARRFKNVVSIDPNRADMEIAGTLAAEAGVLPHLRFLAINAACMPFVDGYFGCVAMMDVLHHLEEGTAILNETVRVLGSEGTVLMADFTDEGLEMISRVHRQEGHEHPVGPVTLDRAMNYLSHKGFRTKVDREGHYHRVIILARDQGRA